MTTLDEQFEDLYGPLAPFSDFKKGEHITYRSEGQTRTGTIVWVATATRIAGRDIPVSTLLKATSIAASLTWCTWVILSWIQTRQLGKKSPPWSNALIVEACITLTWWSNAPIIQIVRTGEGPQYMANYEWVFCGFLMPIKSKES